MDLEASGVVLKEKGENAVVGVGAAADDSRPETWAKELNLPSTISGTFLYTIVQISNLS